MCGISGTVRQSADGPDIIRHLLVAQERRGPDHAEWSQRKMGELNLTFGHNRLAILDLDPRSNQPFVDPESQQLLVYNGEIYNYLELRTELLKLGATFQTTSDTEVLLKSYQHWGVEAFSRFNGMFAFALYDPALKRTLLVRDRYGVKPLYYHLADGRLTFASSPSALAERVQTRFNFNYLENGIATNLYEGLSTETAFEGILALPAGKCLIFEGENLNSVRYYALEERVGRLSERLGQQSFLENAKELKNLLLSSVELRLRSDVPTTLSLSGGLDSGLCAALIREVSGAGFEAFTFANANLPGSESRLAHLTARELGVRLTDVAPEPKSVVDLFEATMTAQGAPFGHLSVLAQNAIFARIHDAPYKVSIGGQGADEGFAGYRKFQLSALKELYKTRQFGKLSREGLGTSWTLLSELNSPQDYLYRLLKSRQKAAPGFFKAATKSHPTLEASTLSARQILDVQKLSLPTLLRYEDSNSMYHSIESRMPFLDYRVMEFGLSLPREQKIKGGFGKYILRHLAEGLLPEEVVWDRNKRAFSLDNSWWLKQGLSTHLQSEIQGAEAKLKPLLTEEARAMLQAADFYKSPRNFTKMTTLAWLARQSSAWFER